MKKNQLILLFFFTVVTIHAQEVGLLIGKNYTTYDLTIDGESANSFDKSGSGSSYEIGVSIPIKVSRLTFDNPLNYSLGLTLNQYNAEAGNIGNQYEWKTEYVGIQNGIAYSFIKSNDIDLSIKGAINVGTMLSGNQRINNSYYDLKTQIEFIGVVLTPSLGMQAKCNLFEYGYLSLGYYYASSSNLSNTSNKVLTFKTHQVLFGIHFEIY